jgi:p-cumate 2,3-dioxygenase subunit alpha
VTISIEDFIVDDPAGRVFRYHRSALTSSEFFALEQEKIFGKCWLYLGHESEVPAVGDYRRRAVAGRVLFFIRNEAGEINVFYNTCTHRGARICRRDQGSAKTFQCFYHAWTFDADGDLLSVPDEESYGPGFDRSRFHLSSPRHDSYRGFHFVCFDESTEDLSDYLGNVKPFIDLICDQSEVGLRVLPGANLYGTRANWKLYCENSMDVYHFVPTHATYLQFIAAQDNGGRDRSGASQVTDMSPPTAWAVGNGHVVTRNPAVGGGRPVARWHPSMGEETREEIEATRRRLVERHGEERASQIADYVMGINVFPNLVFIDGAAPIVRTIWPKAPDLCEINAWVLAPKEESARLTSVRLGQASVFFGGAGFATPDDIEAVESCQEGASTGGVEWSDISRGLGLYPIPTREVQLRSYWREIQARLLDRGHGDDSAEYQLDPTMIPA